MPTIRLSKKVLEQYVGKELPIEILKERISYLGTDLEGIEGDEITIEVFPNRPDMLSVQGFARALSAFIGEKPGLRDYRIFPSGQRVIIEKDVGSVRPYTSCAIVRGLHFNDERIKEVIDIQEKLHITYGRNRKKVAIGIYPCEKIAMPITFTAKDPKDIVFRPLESESEMSALDILESHPTGQAYGHLLKGKEKFPVFIDARGKVLSVPPIINSHETGRITNETRDVFIECSGFEYSLLHTCLCMIVAALSDMGGKVESMELQYPNEVRISPDLSPVPIPIEREYLNRRLGLDIDEKHLKPLLERMGHGYQDHTVMVPAYRADIMHQIDIAEDIAIAYGYEHIGHEMPRVATIAREAPIEKLKEKLAELLVGLGFIEISTYSLSSAEHQIAKMETPKDVIRLSNAISLEYDVLRAWLIPQLLECLSKNSHHEYPQMLFTFGPVFARDQKEETGVSQEERLGIAVCREDAGYTDVRQIADYLLRSCAVSASIHEHDAPAFIKGRSAQLLVGNRILATFGEASPQVLANWGIGVPVALLEIKLSELMGLIGWK